MSISSHQRYYIKKAVKLLNWMKLGKYNYVLYLFVSFWYYYICILSRGSRTEVFLKKSFLKISQNSQENTCTGISVLSATGNFINEETPAHRFPRPLTIFAKTSIVDIPLGYTYATALPSDLKPM